MDNLFIYELHVTGCIMYSVYICNASYVQHLFRCSRTLSAMRWESEPNFLPHLKMGFRFDFQCILMTNDNLIFGRLDHFSALRNFPPNAKLEASNRVKMGNMEKETRSTDIPS